MKLLTRIFHNFFLSKLFSILKSIKYFFFLLLFSNNLLANNEDTQFSILDRLPTSIFATVNEEVISIYDLILRSNFFSVSSNIKIDENFKTNILPELISGLIDEKIQSQEIEKKNIIVSENQVAQMIQNIEKENGMKVGSLKNILKEKKTDISILEKQIKTSIGWRQLVSNKFRSQIIIEESDVDRIHNNLKSNIGKEEYFLEQIFISFENRNERSALERIKNLDKQIKQGGDFLSIAKTFSDSFSGKVGRIGWTPEIDLDQKLLDKIKKIKINQISDPIKGENGYYIVNIKGKRIIGEEIIDKVSLFQLNLIDENEKILSELKKVYNCSELEKFSEKYATNDSGPLGFIKYNELSVKLKQMVRELKKNQISDVIEINSNNFRIMICDIMKIPPIIPSKFKIEEIMISRKLDTLSRQYMTELRANAVIDIKI